MFDTRSVYGDVDKATLYKKGDDCFLAFLGNEDMGSGGDTISSSYHTTPTDWGLKGIHAGYIDELQPLIELMDFGEIRSVCNGALTVTGHSKGAALAQLFSLVINNKDDPWDAGLTVKSLYTFGAVRITEEKQGNDKAADGCFSGGQYWWAEKKGDDYLVDCIAPSEPDGTKEVVKSSGFLVFDDGSSESFPCGTQLPESMASAMLTQPFDKWMQK